MIFERKTIRKGMLYLALSIMVVLFSLYGVVKSVYITFCLFGLLRAFYNA